MHRHGCGISHIESKHGSSLPILEVYKRNGVCGLGLNLDQANQDRLRLQYPSVFYVPSLLAQPYWDRDLPHILQLAKRSFTSIKREFTSVSGRLQDEMEPILRDVAGSGQWKALYLMQEGHWKDNIAALFPHTMELLRQLPVMQNG